MQYLNWVFKMSRGADPDHGLVVARICCKLLGRMPYGYVSTAVLRFAWSVTEQNKHNDCCVLKSFSISAPLHTSERTENVAGNYRPLYEEVRRIR